jgi:hypothetical protein
MRNVKMEMKSRARMVSGLVNLLRDDADQLSADTGDFDLICLEESIKDTKSTIQMLIDNVTELEYLMYLSRKGES